MRSFIQADYTISEDTVPSVGVYRQTGKAGQAEQVFPRNREKDTSCQVQKTGEKSLSPAAGGNMFSLINVFR
jgi:hypothetical protein